MKNIYPFNSVVEYALRCAILLEASYPSSLSMQRMVYYDYLLTHSGDADGPESIHLDTPNRISEISIKREKIDGAMSLLCSKGLARIIFNKEGISYIASDYTTPFLRELSSHYINQLKLISLWVSDKFGQYKESELTKYFNQNINRWGGEFENASLLATERDINE